MQINEFEEDMSRRGFLKGALLGGAALTLSSRLALAEQLATGRKITIDDIRGVGVPPRLVRMALNENPIGPSRMALQAIADKMFYINRYSFGSIDLVKALAAYDGVPLPKGEGVPVGGGFRRRMSTPYVLTAGSGQLLDVLALTYLSHGDGEVIEAELGYGDISRTAEGYDKAGIPTNVIRVPLTKDYRHDLDAMLKAITPKTRMVVITNPNNPTGTIVTYEALEKFVNAAPKNVIIAIDEAYIHFVKDPNYRRAIPLALAHDNVIVTRTFSKVYGMPAMRLGYGVCSQTMQQAMRMYTIGRPNLLAVAAGTAAVPDLDHVRRSQQAAWDFKARCYEEFDKMGLTYIPSESNFMMVDLGRDAMPILRALRKRRVLVTSRNREKMPTWIRVSSGTMPETEVFLQTLREVMTTSI